MIELDEDDFDVRVERLKFRLLRWLRARILLAVFLLAVILAALLSWRP